MTEIVHGGARVTSHFPERAEIALRYVYAGRVWTAQAVRVVQDTPDLVALSLLPDTVCQVPTPWLAEPPGAPRSEAFWKALESRSWSLESSAWHTSRLLILLEPGRHYGVHLFWSGETGRFGFWYVNFQVPFRRTPIGFDTFDLALDLVVAPDRRWGWKDVEEYAEGVRRGVIDTDAAAGVEAARTEVLARVDAAASPFDDTWTGWTPPALHPPVLPAGWETVAS